MNSIIPLFVSHYSLGGKSLLTLEEPGKAKPGNPLSVFDLAAQASLKEVVLIDNRIDGFLSAYKVSSKLGIKLCYGIKLVICADMGDKTHESRATESSVVVLVRDSQGYSDLIKIWNRAWGHEGHFTHRTESYGRGDWKLLKTFWTEHLGLALPFFGSFIAKNTLTFARVMPDLPVTPWVFKEVDSGLPFAPLIDSAIDRYVGGDTSMVVPSKTILYPDSSWFRAYMVFRAINERSSFDKPNVDHLSSDHFSFANWKQLVISPAP